jgi:hypothetical protein
MGSWLSRGVVAVLTTAALSGTAFAGQIWTDIDGDGLPGDQIYGQVSDNVLVDVWIDSQSFAFTQFQVVVDIGGADFVGGGAVLPPCAKNFLFLQPLVIAQGTLCGPQHGVLKAASFTVHIKDCVTCFVPVIQDSEFGGGSTTCGGDTSRLVNGPATFCFQTAGFDCMRCDLPTASESVRWGKVKGLYQ